MILTVSMFLSIVLGQSLNQTIISDDGSLSLTFNTVTHRSETDMDENDSETNSDQSYESDRSYVQAYWRLKQPINENTIFTNDSILGTYNQYVKNNSFRYKIEYKSLKNNLKEFLCLGVKIKP